MRGIILLVALAVAGIGAGLIASAGGEANATRGASATTGAAGCGPVDFDHYDAGATVDGIRRAETIRRCEPDVGAPTRIDMVATLYGSCEPVGSDGGCAPPVQIQSWPACERNLAL